MPRQLRWLVLIPLALVPIACARPAAKELPSAATNDQAAAIAWSYDYDAALAQAKEEGKPLMVDFFATWCKPCQLLDEEVFSRSEVADASRDYVCVKVDGDKYPDLREKLDVTGYPTVLFLSPDQTELGRVKALVSYRVMVRSMAAAAEKAGVIKPESD